MLEDSEISNSKPPSILNLILFWVLEGFVLRVCERELCHQVGTGLQQPLQGFQGERDIEGVVLLAPFQPPSVSFPGERGIQTQVSSLDPLHTLGTS